MHKSIPIIFAILALLVLCLCSACVSQSSPIQSSQNNTGFTQITQSPDYSHISFEEAKVKLIEYRSNSLNEPSNANSVYYMRSRDMDESGNATGWIFGVYNGPVTEFLVYDRIGWTNIENVTLPQEEFTLDTVVSPNFLFSQNRDMIARNSSPEIPERLDLELQRGYYKVIITSVSTTRTLSFNATTGALIT